MNTTAQKAAVAGGIVIAVLTAIIIDDIEEHRNRLQEAILDNARQDAEIRHNSEAYNKLDLRLKELHDISILTNNSVIRVEEHIKTFEVDKRK